jgi:hypothetical protein
MRTLGFTIARMEPGEIDLAMDYSPALTQQNGFVHAGIITAGLKPGRTLTISEARAYALRDGGEHDRDHDRHVEGDGSPRGAERFRTSVVPGLI